MNILIVDNSKIPAIKYGGTERVIWSLGKELAKIGHHVSFLVAKGSTCDFAKIIEFDPTKSISSQIPQNIDIIHLNDNFDEIIEKPHIVTLHGNSNKFQIDHNTVFVSKNHAARYGSDSFVLNGLDWDEYGKVDLTAIRHDFHFLGKAAWHIKNVQGAIDVVRQLKGERLNVLGGSRLNLKMGFRLTLSPKIRFHGMVGGEEKYTHMHASKGLIFPVKWHEPFGLAITESLYFGAPVFGTPYGSLPELITPEVGFLTNSCSEMVEHIANNYDYSHKKCHEYARDMFNSRVMAKQYLKKYERVLNGKPLNKMRPQEKESVIEPLWTK